MSAPDELRQLAAELEHRATQNGIVRSYGIMPSSRPEDDERDRAAAVALHHHANLIDTIDRKRLRQLADNLENDRGIRKRWYLERNAKYLRRLAQVAWDSGIGAAVSPSPAPTTCPTCGSADPEVSRTWVNSHSGGFCPNSWHQELTED